MRFVLCLALALGFSGAATPALRAGGKEKDAGTPTPAEAVRKALDQKVTLDYNTQSLQDAIEHLRQKTKINFVLDSLVLQQMGIGIDGGQPTPVLLKVTNGKVRQAVQGMLNAYHLTYVILGDSVLITTEEMAHLRQMRQRVSLDLDAAPLAGALKRLSRETGANLIIDPAAAKQAQAGVTLQLDDTSLETAVRLLTEMGGLKSVRIGNVLFVTTEDRAAKLRKENPGTHTPMPFPMGVFPQPGIAVPGFPGGGALPVPGGAAGVAPDAPRVAPARGVPAPPPPPK
jgi:type II secretory pathway component GspD/PulD (secretin)